MYNSLTLKVTGYNSPEGKAIREAIAYLERLKRLKLDLQQHWESNMWLMPIECKARVDFLRTGEEW